MKPSNNPDLALAQEWLAELDLLYEQLGLLGFDPFDVKQHPRLRALQRRPLLRKTASFATDLCPHLARRALHIQPSENPKAFALMAQGSLRMYQLTGEPQYRARCETLLDWLLRHPAHGPTRTGTDASSSRLQTPDSGLPLSWAYPFDVFGAGVDTPAGTPVSVVTAIAGDTLLRAYEVLGDDAYLAAARRVAAFFAGQPPRNSTDSAAKTGHSERSEESLTGKAPAGGDADNGTLPRLAQEDGTFCFAYTPSDARRVHNANLLAAEFLYKFAAATGEGDYRETARPALEFTLHRQRPDGSWPYGEWAPGDPYERALMDMVDHHHTGFVLRSLYGIRDSLRAGAAHDPEQAEEVLESLHRGYRFYRRLFSAEGMPLTGRGKYPVDIHSCAEAVLCPVTLSGIISSARHQGILALRWAYYYMRDERTGAPFYRKYPFFTSRIHFPRWGTAWMYRAIAEYLWRLYPR